MNSSNTPPLMFALLAIGLALLLLAPWIPSLAPAQAIWSDQQAQEYGQAAANLHDALHSKAHKHGPGHIHRASSGNNADDLLAAQAEFKKQEANLQAARSRLYFWQYCGQGLGILLIVAGVGLYCTARPPGERNDKSSNRRK
jgi:hypothetical protein